MATDNSPKVRCNNCMQLWIDDDDVPLIRESNGGMYHGCPTCNTDGFLMDLAPGQNRVPCSQA